MEVIDGHLNLVDPAVPFIDPLALLVEFAEDESELVLDLHGDLETSTVFVSQDSAADPSSLGSDL
jgi:hypothetical protein